MNPTTVMVVEYNDALPDTFNDKRPDTEVVAEGRMRAEGRVTASHDAGSLGRMSCSEASGRRIPKRSIASGTIRVRLTST